jgi:hypothetical protein
MTRVPWACLTVMACLTVGACGDKSDSGVPAPKAQAGRDSGLGVKRFAALDSVFAAAVPLDKYQDQNDLSFERFREDSKPLLKACSALPEDDALMRAMRSGCPLIAELVEHEAGIGTCDSSATCLRSVRAFRRRVKRVIAVSRRTDRVVAAERTLVDACKQALKTPRGAYAAFEGYDSAMLLMQRALRSSSPAALDDAQKRLAAADQASKTMPSSKVLLGRFRSGCD